MIFNFRLDRGFVVSFAVFFAAFPLIGCGKKGRADKSLQESVDSFAVNYFNWRYADAARFCTEESGVWLRYAASNVVETDIDSLHAKPLGAEYAVTGVEYPTDTTAIVALRLGNVLVADTVGCPPHTVDKGSATVELRLRDRWMVHLTSLPAVVAAD